MDVKQVGYARKLVMDEKVPKSLLDAYGTKALVVWRGEPLPGHAPAASIGRLTLYVMEREQVPPPSAQRVVCEPVLCARRGRQVTTLLGVGGEKPVGIDDEVCTDTYLVDRLNELTQGGLSRSHFLREETDAPPPPVVPPPPPKELAYEPELFIAGLELIGLTQAKALLSGAAVCPRIAILDESFAGLPEGFPTPRFVGLPRPSSALAVAPTEPAHGTRMAVALHEALGNAVTLELYRMVPREADTHSSWIAPTDVALTLADAIGQRNADVVLIPMGDGLWGTPKHLLAVLREARRMGRGGRGVPIICATGDSTWNHDRDQDTGISYAMGADELHSQPWVMAVAAADTAGRWYRRFKRESCAPIGRFGPAVALSAPGEMYRLETLDKRLVDDTSIASALVAASAAAVLRQAPELDADEVRAILQWTADPAPIVDSGPGPARDVFNEWDRLGHNLKLGAGRVNALAATLAAGDPVCSALLLTRPWPGRLPTRGVAESEPAFLRALSWYGWTRRSPASVAQPWRALLEDYLQVRGRLARLMLHSWRWREALMWLARHLMALSEVDDKLMDAEGKRDHGALVQRVSYVLEVLRSELETPALQAEAPALQAWLEKMELGLKDLPGGRLQWFLFGPRGVFASTWIPGPATLTVEPPQQVSEVR